MTGNVKFEQKKRDSLPAQALVEVAIVLPILLLLVLGAMDFGRMFFTKIALTNAAREGANYLAYYPQDKDTNYTETKKMILDETSNLGVVVVPLFSENSDTWGERYVEITVKATDIPLIFGAFYHQFFTTGEEITLSSTVRMMVLEK